MNADADARTVAGLLLAAVLAAGLAAPAAAQPPPLPTLPPPVPQCANLGDDDGDGTRDSPLIGDDPGCSSLLDGDEHGTAACDDGLDNDGDGLADYRVDGAGDPGCAGLDDASERGDAACDNGLDDDGDGAADFSASGAGDPGCAGPEDASERGALACDNGLDDDGDGLADHFADGSGDPGCEGPGDGSELGALQCDDGADNDGDGLIDHRPDGSGDPGCLSPYDDSEGRATFFADGFDDGDVSDWTRSGLWRAHNCRAASPRHALAYNQGGCPPNFATGAATSGNADSATFFLPTEATNVVLSFRSYYQDEGGTFFDREEVYVSVNAGPWDLLLTELGPMNGWNAYELEAPAEAAGGTLQLRFRFNSVDSLQNNFEGWYVDDVVVSGDVP